MKATLCAVLACLLLCGCGAVTPETTAATTLPAEPTAEPPGSYEPGNALELATGGAVRVYPQELGNIRMIRAVGNDLLVFSDKDTTTVSRLAGETLFRVAEIKLDQYIVPIYTDEERIVYLDSNTRELVFLDRNLHEAERMAMPGDMMGAPALTADGTRIYYCNSSGVRCLEMETGISRLIKEMTFTEQSMADIHMGDTVLQVETVDRNGNREILFLDAQTGAMLGALPEGMILTTGETVFYAIAPEGMVSQMLFGTEDQVWQLTPENYLDSGIFLPEAHAALVLTREGSMDYYDLSSGKRTGTLALGDIQLASPTVSDQGYLYFVHDNRAIYRWATDASGDETVYTGPWYSFYAPDAEGLAKCRAYAENLSQQFGLEIQLVTEAVDLHPEDYDLIPEYQVPVIMDALTKLEDLLSRYPAGMFAASVEGLENGKLTVLLVRNIRRNYDSVSSDGLHFWQGSQSTVVLAIGEEMEAAFHRQMYHALESRLLSRSSALYRWDELNPPGFVYDCDLAEIPNRDTETGFSETNGAFVDAASMESPKADRAAVMACACMPGNEIFFRSDVMQNKLRALCEGIREAYGLKKYSQPLLWEQYLESSITK